MKKQTPVNRTELLGYKLRKSYMYEWNSHLEILIRSQTDRKFWAKFYSKQSLGAPGANWYPVTSPPWTISPSTKSPPKIGQSLIV